MDIAEPWNAPTNRVRAKAASPQVISSILNSLDELTPLPNVPLTNDAYSDNASKRSRAESSSRSVASSASYNRIVTSPGFGVEYGTGLQLDDEEGLSDAALPPTIPTSRPPSGLSNYTTNRSPVFSKASTAAIFRTKPSSRRSSFSTSSDAAGGRRNKLSSESWVRMNAEGGDDKSITSRGRTPRKSLRRVESHEFLRPSTSASSKGPTGYFPPVSLAEQIIARNPPPTATSKGRLYLTDATINEHQPLADTPISPFPPSSAASSPYKAETSPSGDKLAVAVTRTPPLKTPSPISDSIPTRTSSLRAASKSPSSKKRKSKKSKKQTTTGAKSQAMDYKQPVAIPDSSWADLGEDDETVKRIKQLREQRKSRLQELTLYTYSDFSQADAGEKSTPVHELSTPQNESTNGAPRSRPAPTRASTEPPHEPRTPTLQEADIPLSHSDEVYANGVRAFSESPSAGRQTKYHMDVKRPISTHKRPTTAKSERSTVQPYSLDYSYSEAVDVLSDVEIARLHEDQLSRDSSQRDSLQLKGLDLPPARSQITRSAMQHKLSKKSKKPQTGAGSDFEGRKNRRKSMSDARLARAALEDDLARRDSIEDAVTDYLRAARLSRTIKNPSTGRTIAFSEVGDPEGAAVFVCVGMGLTRYVTAFFDELASTLRLRLITLDRPGVGGSAPLPSSDKSGPLNWPEDVVAVCQHLGIVRFSILAHSAGAIYALATALILPHLVKGKVHLLAPWVPPSQLEALSHPATSAPPANPLPRSQRFLRVLPTPFLRAANTPFMTATSASLKPAKTRNTRSGAAKTPSRRPTEYDDSPTRPMSTDRPDYSRRESMMLMDRFMPTTNPLENFPPTPLKEEDERGFAAIKRESLVVSATATPTDPNFAYATIGLNAAEHAEKERQLDYSSRLTQRTWELATKDSNPATDLLVCLERTRDVGFRYTDVGRQVVITHGSEDKRVPVANVKWLAEQMNRRALGLNFGEDGRESRDSYPNGSISATGGCEVRVLEGEGHGLMASPTIMSDILTEISGYWAGTDRGRL